MSGSGEGDLFELAATGLPMAFGKQRSGSVPTGTGTLSQTGPDRRPNAVAGSSSAGATGSGGRGARGIVGGGKRGRGRGGGHVSGDMAMNGGVKRPYAESNSTPLNFSTQEAAAYPTSSRSNPNGMSLGPRGCGAGGFQGGHQAMTGGQGVCHHSSRGGGRGGSGGRGAARGGNSEGGYATPEKGFYKPSFEEDPWRDLMAKRETATGGRAPR